MLSETKNEAFILWHTRSLDLARRSRLTTRGCGSRIAARKTSLKGRLFITGGDDSINGNTVYYIFNSDQ